MNRTSHIMPHSITSQNNPLKDSFTKCKKFVQISMLSLVMLAFTAQTYGDGCFVWGRFEDLHAPEQKVAIVWDGKRQTMVLATRVQASEIDDFGWIIPIETTSKPEVELGDSEIFDLLKDYFKLIPPMHMTLGMNLEAPNVQVIETKDVGIYKVTIVKATDATALSTWLQRHGFKSGPSLKRMLNTYALEDFFFVLAKIDLSLQYQADIDYLSRQEYVADVQSLDGKAIKVLAALRWPTGSVSLAQLVVQDICAGKPYRLSHLASHPLNKIYHLVTPHDYETLLKRYSDATNPEQHDLVKSLSERFLNHECIQPFVRIENVYKDLEAGVANPLRISFEPKSAFFPMRISSVNKGEVAVVAYVLAPRPMQDMGNTLKAEVWKRVDDAFARQMASYLNPAKCRCLTKLTFSGSSSQFDEDVRFEPMEEHRKKYLFEDRQIFAPKFAMALWSMNVDVVRKILAEHPQAHEFVIGSPVVDVLHHSARNWAMNTWIDPVDEVFLTPTEKTQESPNETSTERLSGSYSEGALTRLQRIKTVIDLLLEHGFDINAGGRRGSRPMHIVAQIGIHHSKVASDLGEFLLRREAEINPKDSAGKTPLDYIFDHVQQYSNDSLPQMAVFLIRHGATLSAFEPHDLQRIRSRFTEAVLPVARQAGNEQIVTLLGTGDTPKR